MTDPNLLGPCQPGTAVKLQGAVLQESEKGKMRVALSNKWQDKREWMTVKVKKTLELFQPSFTYLRIEW